jgi:transcriptional regulator with XRE-family HTH domain
MKPKPALRAYRVSRGLRAEDIAKKLGIHPATVRSYENGNREISGDVAVHIENKLGIDRELLRPDLFRRCA